MKNDIKKIIIYNILLWVILIIVFSLSAFLSGYGSNIDLLLQEKILFLKFTALHFIINLYLLYKNNQRWVKCLFVSVLTIAILYLIAAWYFGYFNI